ncbi:4-carboxymuconolactone decarboxylase [Rhodobacteraceae bacterium WD3A24]|nr:4-carboxymuconolactone decarboxylase [Rhodobacteraceae bacterium WD3A24]
MTNARPPRLSPPAPLDFTDRQREVHDEIASGPRGAVRGPLAVWLHRPELAERAQALGRYCRYETLLPPKLSELAILTTAVIWGAEFEWQSHEPAARAAGLAAGVIDALRSGLEPEFDTAEEAVVHAFTRAAHIDRQVDDALYARAVEVLGRDTVVDLVGLIGYYSLISLTINIFRVPASES